MTKRGWLALLMALMVLGLCGCAKERVVGAWRFESLGDALFGPLSSYGAGTVTLAEDGGMTIAFDFANRPEDQRAQANAQLADLFTCRYEVKGKDQVVFTVVSLGEERVVPLSYRLEGDTLTLGELVLTRQEKKN